MILVDFSQIMYSNLFAHIRPGQPIQEDMIRHMVVMGLGAHKRNFEEKYGRMVICIDNRHYWRKDIFQYYKKKRKEDRDESGFDWDTIFEAFSKIKAELVKYMPYQVLDVPSAEADDIIGVLAKTQHLSEKVLILSGDKDFPQLQKYKNIFQYAPVQKEWMKTDDPAKFLKMHIMKGDWGDGIPNFLSPDDIFVRKDGKQKSLRHDKLELWATLPPDRFCTTDMMRGYLRNESLVDLEKIPDYIQKRIIDRFHEPFDSSNTRIADYFMKYKLQRALASIQQFKVIKTKFFGE